MYVYIYDYIYIYQMGGLLIRDMSYLNRTSTYVNIIQLYDVHVHTNI